jgi:ABC-2 type transport system ATP-binding protein
MQQRLGLGVALLGSPEVVLLDEPTSALDPVGRHDVREIIRTLRERGVTVFLNSHLLSEVEQVCDRVIIVDHGKVIADGTLDELLRTDTVRLRVSDLPRDATAQLTPFGTIAEEGEWLVVRAVDAERVPEIVAAIVRMGGRVYAVEPKHESLEDRFLRLLGGA